MKRGRKQSEDLEILGNFEEIELYFVRKDCPGGRNGASEAEERIYVKISSRNVSVSSEMRNAENTYYYFLF